MSEAKVKLVRNVSKGAKGFYLEINGTPLYEVPVRSYSIRENAGDGFPKLTLEVEHFDADIELEGAGVAVEYNGLPQDEAQLLFDVLETLSQQIGNVAPGAHEGFYADYDKAWGILRRYGAVGK